MGNHFYYLNLFWIMHEDCDVSDLPFVEWEVVMVFCVPWLSLSGADVPCEKEGFEHFTTEHKRSSCLSPEECRE